MAKAPERGSSADHLVEYLFGGATDAPLGAELHAWLAGSPRFRDFTEAHRDKVRKKLRSAQDRDALRDVRAELRAAHLLLTDRRMELAFEAYGSAKAAPTSPSGSVESARSTAR